MLPYRVKLRRSLIDRALAGICGGAGESLGISGWWVRLTFITLSLVNWWFALLIYALLWVSVPAQRLGDLPPLNRPGDEPRVRLARPEGILTLAAGAILTGIVILIEQTGALRTSGGGNLLIPIMLLLIGLSVMSKHLRGAA